MDIRNLISFSIIAVATFVALYLFSDYNIPYVIATSVVVGAIYTFIVSQLGRKWFYNRVLKNMMDKHKDEES